MAIYAIGAAADVTKRWLPITVCLLVLTLFQFQSFYRDYLTDYPLRALGHFEGNRRAALQDIFALTDRHPRAKVFVSTRIEFAESFWHFYATMLKRDDLQGAMSYADPDTTTANDVPAGALALMTPGDKEFAARLGLILLKPVKEPDGTSFFWIMKKEP